MVPDFQQRGSYQRMVLPEGVHTCDEKEFKLKFDSNFSGSSTRNRICEGFLKLRTYVDNLGIVAIQWIDGSYVEYKLNPGDVDVVTFIDYEFGASLDNAVCDLVFNLLDGKESTKAIYGSHTFLCPSCQEGHHFYKAFEEQRKYWRKWFGTTRDRDDDGRPTESVNKGFIEMTLGDPSSAPKISKERSV